MQRHCTSTYISHCRQMSSMQSYCGRFCNAALSSKPREHHSKPTYWGLNVNISVLRQFSSTATTWQKAKAEPRSAREVVKTSEKPFSELTLGEKVQQVGKDATYTGIIIAGIAITGVMFYAIGRELFSGQSPSGVYSRAVKLCSNSELVIDAIGEPMKAYGEENRRGRRRFVRHAEYEAGGVMHMRVQFYLEGPLNKGTVHADMKQDDRGKYQFDYVVVELQNFPRKVLVVEDRRSTIATA